MVAEDEITGDKVVIEKCRPFNIKKATTDHWYDLALGTSEVHISIALVSKNNYIAIEVYINNNKELYDSLYLIDETIEKIIKMRGVFAPYVK